MFLLLFAMLVLYAVVVVPFHLTPIREWLNNKNKLM